MLNRTLLFLVITAVVSALLLFSMSSATADEERTFFHIDQTIMLGQSQHDSHRSPTFGEQIKRMWNKLTQDDNLDHNHSNNDHRPAQVATTPAIPVQPPRPLTAAETLAATNQPPQRTNTGNTPSPRAGSVPSVFRNTTGDGNSEDEQSPYERMNELRRPHYTREDVQRAASESRKRTITLTPSPILGDVGSNFGGLVGDLKNFTDIPPVPGNSTVPSAQAEGRPDVFVPIVFDPPSGSNYSGHITGQVSPQPTNDPFPPQQTALQPVQSVPQRPVVAPEQPRGPTKQLLVSASPQLAFEIEKPPSAIKGQEIIYRIRATNIGDVPAEDVKLNVEIPPWIDIRHTDADNGNCVLLPRGDGSGVADLEWRVNRINQGETNLLAMWLVPQQHRAVELPMQYDFRRPPIVARVEVQEPRLAMELIGPDEVRWNDPVTYMLIVRNIGNGSADRLRFELSQTSTENAATVMEEPLLPGEGREIPISVRAGREQEQIDIAVSATGAHDLKSEVRRRIKVLRPKLDISVQTSPMHFVDEPAEMLIRVVNHGNADAENITIRAELPLGAQHLNNSEGGLFVQPHQQNFVEWRGRSVGKGEVQTFSLICIPKREGECRVSVEASEANGIPLIAGHGTFVAEAIVDLNLTLLRPSGPIELGQEVTYTIEVTNTGTKAAEDVEISMMFGEQLEPTAVAGREAYYSPDGQVFFEKLPVILPKQCIPLRVSVEAKGIGTAQIRAEVVRTDANGTSVRLEQGLSATIFSRQSHRGAAVAEQPTQNEVFR